MVSELIVKKTCPKCGEQNYMFKGRKVIDGGTVIETKYKCRACGHEWKVRVETGQARQSPSPPGAE